MQFIEGWLGLAPDGGNGAVELAVLMTCACAVAAVVTWRRRRTAARAAVAVVRNSVRP